MTDPHNLTIHPRRHSLNVDGVCSCHAFHIRNRSRADVHAEHTEHVRLYLGPEAQERRLDGGQ